MGSTALADVPRGTTPRPVVVLDDILLDLIDVGDNVRVDVGELEELAASIAELGVLDPVKVTKQEDGRYRLVWGQRRVLASRVAGANRIPAIIQPAGDIDAKSALRSIEQLSENLQRKDLNDIEEAVALRDVLDANPKLTQAALAKRLGMSAPWIANTLRLLDTAPEVQAKVRTGVITAAHAKAIAALDVDLQADFVDKVVSGGWSSHEVERQAKYVADNAKQVRERKATDERRTTEAIALLEKVANRDTATIAVSSYYGSDGVQKGLAADGWKTLTGNAAWQVRAVDNAGECGCKGVWRVEIPYDAKSKVKLGPGCTSDEHAKARSVAQDAKWEQQRKNEAAARRAQEQAAVARGARVTAFLVDPATASTPFAQRLTLYALLDEEADDAIERYVDEESRAGFYDLDDPLWSLAETVPDDALATEIARQVTARVFAWGSGPLVKAAIDAALPAEPEPAPPEGALPRGICATCRREVALRKGGLTREHRPIEDRGDETICDGSGKAAA